MHAEAGETKRWESDLVNMHGLHEEHQAFQGSVEDLGRSVRGEGVIEVRR